MVIVLVVMMVVVVMNMIMVVMIVLVVVVVLLLLLLVVVMMVVVVMNMMVILVLVMMLMVVVMVVVMMPITVGDDAIEGHNNDSGWGALNWGTCKCLVVWVHVLLFLPNSFKSPPNSPKYIFFNTGSARVWILCQIICNRLVARIALQPQYSVNFDPCPLG